MTSPSLARSGVALLLAAGCAFALPGCGNNAPVQEDASDGTPFQVSATASFPKTQRVAGRQTLKITVRNDEDSRILPDVAIVLRGLSTKVPGGDNGNGQIADRNRPVWIVDRPPSGGTTAYVDTWALGPLKAGQERTFTWELTPVLAGEHPVSWSVAGSLDQDGPVAGDDGKTSGSFDIKVAG